MTIKERSILRALYNDTSALDPNNNQHGPSSTAIMADAELKDGYQKQDLKHLVTNMSLDQGLAGNPEAILTKIEHTLSQYPNLLDELSDFIVEQGFPEPGETPEEEVLYWRELINSFLTSKIKMAKGGQFEDITKFKTVTIGDVEYNLLVLKTEEEKEKGLMGVTQMNDDEGALFDYSDKPMSELSFWMKDTQIPLYIIFVGEDKTIIDVKTGTPNSEDYITCVSEDNKIIYVIELTTNVEVSVGDEVKFESLKPSDLDPEKLHVLNEDGSIQAVIDAGTRIFSRRSTAVMIKKAKKANESKSDVDYKDLGRYIFGELDRQENRDPEWVEQ